MTALSDLSKSDTVFLSFGPTAAGLATDVGQERQSLTNHTTWVGETSDRAGITSPREVSIVVDLRSTDAAFLLEHGNGSAHTYRVEVFGSNILCTENGTLKILGTVPGLAGTARKILIHWSVRPDGDGTQSKSELLIYNFVTTTFANFTALHTPGSTAPGYAFVINGDGAGAGGLASIGDFHSVRIGRRFHSTTEGKEDWVQQSTPPDLAARRRLPMLPLLPEVAAEGEFAGPGYGAPLANTRSVELRAVGPLVNMRPLHPHAETNDYDPPHFFRAAPDAATFHWCLRYVRHVLAPSKCNRARVRIHVTEWKTSPAGATQCELLFACYSIAFLPVVGASSPMKFTRTPASSINTDHTVAGVGAWIDLGTMDLTCEPGGRTYLALGFSFNQDQGTAGEANTSFRINAWTVEPLRDDGDDDGLDDFDFGG